MLVAPSDGLGVNCCEDGVTTLEIKVGEGKLDIDKGSANEEVKDKEDVNTIENEDAVIIDDDEGFIIEEKVVDEGEDGVGIGVGEDGEDADDLDDGCNTGDVSKESVDTGRKVVGNPVIDADEEE